MFVVNLQSRHSKVYFKVEVGFGLFECIYIHNVLWNFFQAHILGNPNF